MALVRKTVLDEITIKAASGVLLFRFDKQIVDDATGEVVSSQFHRTSLEPGVSLDQQMAAVNAHLLSMGVPAVEGKELEVIQPMIALVQTPEKIQAFVDMKAAAAAAEVSAQLSEEVK